jgi:hypothetical protein
VGVPAKNLINLAATVKTTHIFGRGDDAEVVQFDELGRPVSLLGLGHHFNDAKINRHR